MRYSGIYITAFLFLFCIRSSSQAQDSIVYKNTILPLAFYLPETSLGLGGTGILTFRSSAEAPSLRPSQILYSAVYTLKNQLLLFFPFEIYLKENRSRLKGELGYYRYFYNYYGIGGESKEEDLLIYSANFPRIEFTYTYSRYRKFYSGIGFKFDHYDFDHEEMWRFPSEIWGGNKINLLVTGLYDTRNNLFAPDKGFYFEVIYETAISALSDFSYNKWTIDLRTYLKLGSKTIVALRNISAHASRSTPFFDLPYISTPRQARGFNDRRFIDKNVMSSQLEIRRPLWGRFIGAAFLSVNQLWTFSLFDVDPTTKLGFGGGIRYEIDPVERTRIRLDVASGAGNINFYITMNEAF